MNDSKTGDNEVLEYPVSTSLIDEGTERMLDDDDSYQKMQARIILLSFALFEKGFIPNALHIGFTDNQTISFAERIRKLLVFETLSENLLQEIIPLILGKTSFSIHHEWLVRRDRVEGGIDPIETARLNPMALSMGALYAQHRQKKGFLTPENILVGMTINMLIDDARGLLDDSIHHGVISSVERDLLTHSLYKSRAIKKLRIPALMCREAERLLNERIIPQDIEKKAVENIYRSAGVRNSGYLQLLTWRKKYLELDVTGGQTNVKAPARPVSQHQGYELLVLMELILLLSKSGRVRQLQPMTVKDRRPAQPVFECVFSKQEKWEIYYQTAAPVKDCRYVEDLTGIPDFIIKNTFSNRIILCDAKKYMLTSYGGAIFKMLGYLYQFGYPEGFDRIAGGVLFMPGQIGQEPGWMEWTGRSEKSQSINTVTIPVSGIEDQAIKQSCCNWVRRAREMLF